MELIGHGHAQARPRPYTPKPGRFTLNESLIGVYYPVALRRLAWLMA